jgi:hypothetical protein
MLPIELYEVNENLFSVIVSMQKGLLLVLCAVLFGASFTVWHELLNAVLCLICYL